MPPSYFNRLERAGEDATTVEELLFVKGGYGTSQWRSNLLPSRRDREKRKSHASAGGLLSERN